MDISVRIARFPRPGETIPGTALHRSLGGKGANQAVAIARLGCDVSLVGAVADDAAGDDALRLLEKAGVDTALVARKSGAATGLAMITIDEAAQNQIVVVAGANALLSAADLESCVHQISRAKIIVSNLESPQLAIAHAFATARENGIPTILNPAPWLPCETLLSLADWIIPNEVETQHLCGIMPSCPITAAAAAARIRADVPTISVALTLGKRGSWIDCREFVGLVPGFMVTAVDTVGAGDTWVGAFAVELARGSEPATAARFANAAAALSVTRLGAQVGMPNRAEVSNFLGTAPLLIG